MGAFWISLRILLLGYERIAGKKIGEKNSSILSAWGFFGFSLLSMLPFIGFVNWDIIKVSFISGSIYSFSFFLYMYALTHEDISVVAPLYNINTIFLIFGAYFTLNEPMNFSKFFGSILMIYGVSFLKKSNKIYKSYVNVLKSKGALSMIVSSILIAVGRIVDGFLTKEQGYNPIGYSVGVYFVMTIYFFVSSVLYERGIKHHIILVKDKLLYLILGGFCNAYAYIALLKAFRYIDISVAEPLSMLSAVVSILFARVFYKEAIKIRLVGTAILISGAFIIYQ
ncbi:EamA family transporter [Thermosipho ferrireducens]|uniref:EamA family transporter n=1 Tax=Thermosipho ferrireducens TaxID=2571116 RepID=A0ABX7S5V0_9BACT|nr:EamA family transporter [Thermosipho ferrireducens]QTA37944.1 EamA family transporter [Thermosipho ferrireducens]